jgi:uncharacterized membrane protein
MAYAYALHWLGLVVWIGGMAFAHFVLRPSLVALAPPVRLALLAGVFARFLPIAGVAIAAVVVSGAWLIHVQGGVMQSGAGIRAMAGTGVLMVLIYGYVALAPYRRLRTSVAAGDFGAAAQAMRVIRALVALNLGLGAVVILVAAWHRAA